MNRINTLLIYLILNLPVAMPAIAEEITASVDRNPVNLNDSFRIIFKAEDTPDGEPDFSPLEQDFSVLNQSQSANKSWVNGRFSSTVQWTVNAMAKRSGNLTIPAIQFGADSSNAITVQVTEDNNSQSLNSDRELFLEIEAGPENPYLQAQVIYTLRLYTRVDIAQARLTEPESADAVVEKLGEDSNYNTQVNGVNYSVTERHYAIFPQKSGDLTIKPLVLTAEVLTTGTRPLFNGFFNSQMSKTTRVESKAITLHVKPAPASFTGKHWLPAEHLEISQQWSGDIHALKTGEPLTRTLTVQAKGSTVGQLPELATLSSHDQLKSYPDQPVLKEQKNNDGLSAYRQEKIALLAGKAGEYRLPEIAIPWFNTKTQKMAIAKLPETVLTAVAGAETPAPKPIIDSAPATEAKEIVAGAPTPATIAESSQITANSVWPWLSAFLAFGWLVTVVFFVLQNRRGSSLPATVTPVNSNEQFQLKQLQQACTDNNPQAAKDALLAWGNKEFSATSLGAVALVVDARLRDEILLLNEVLYGQTGKGWTGKPLLKAFSEQQARNKLLKTEPPLLQPLYRL